MSLVLPATIREQPRPCRSVTILQGRHLAASANAARATR
jgi:hypothetical protein